MYLVGVCSQRDTESAGQTEIRQLEVAVFINQEVLRLEVTVQNSVGMAVLDALAQLHHELLHHLVVHAQALARQTGALRQRLASATLADWQRLHVLLQIQVKELEDEV
jgi:hypothetical protein